jgi:hypothetical protein
MQAQQARELGHGSRVTEPGHIKKVSIRIQLDSANRAPGGLVSLPHRAHMTLWEGFGAMFKNDPQPQPARGYRPRVILGTCPVPSRKAM